MGKTKLDYSIFDRFNFERKPVGVKYSLKQPEGIAPLDKPLAICEMFAEAQTGEPFYATVESTQCGEHVVGFEEFPPLMYSGQLGPSFSMFRNPAANRRVYDYIQVLPKDSVKYISHASIDRMDFDPDLLMITADTRQAEILLRASSFTSGKMWSMRGSTCLACAWLYAYPYLSGEWNLSISGLGYSMKARGVLPDGLLILSIPRNLLPGLLEDLNDMEWDPDWYSLGREGFIKAVRQLEKDIKEDLSIEEA
jgi:uncharacterized protein (DUF169 family)